MSDPDLNSLMALDALFTEETEQSTQTKLTPRIAWHKKWPEGHFLSYPTKIINTGSRIFNAT